MHDFGDILSEPSAAAELPVVQVGDAAATQGDAAERFRRRWSWRLSLLLHTSALAALFGAFLVEVSLSPPLVGGQSQLAAVAQHEAVPPLIVMIAGMNDERPSAAELADAEIDRLAREAPPAELARELLDPAAGASPAAAAWVQQRMLDEIAAAERTSTAEQQQRLAQLGQQLERISAPDSVDAINGKLGALLGTTGRATQPAAEPVAGDFDFDTAQLHDVKRTEKAGGGYDYVAILLDAAGRTMDSSLTEAEGEQLYKTFEIIKANPLLERIYRGVVMSLVDKLARPASAPKAGEGR